MSENDYGRIIENRLASRRGRGLSCALEMWSRSLLHAPVLMALVLAAAGPAAAAEPAAAPAPITVTAKLVEIPSKFPPDDLYDYAYVMRYEVTGGPLDKQSIFVAHYKPRQARGKIKDKMKPFVAGKVRSFQAGDVHKLKLSGDLKKIWTGALVDEFAATDRKSTRYWCLEVDPA
jgi:hypothetical protein